MYIAFTLAEVLTTLGIIGIIAAMTLPAITQSAKRKEASARLKKFDSMFQQAILLSESVNGETEYWNKSSEVMNDGVSDKFANAKLSQEFFEKYLKPYIKYTTYDKSKENDKKIKDYELRIILLDGSILYWHNGYCVDVLLDVNGEKSPNESGYDRFYFLLCNSRPNAKMHCGSENTHWCSYAPANALTRERALQLCKTAPQYCSTLLRYDNYEFKNDYPYHI